ncbi:MAG TPA: dolichyl-phosphate beta-glucosyltransferase [Candidatus Dormibacteraeota bacterium]|nr:dolichyl-phosphate beta-glucosyltransferase [Candidatus Dormibacteraeota bacterium]
MQAPPRLSIVIPAYNEQARILGSLKAAEAYLLKAEEAAEIVVVDDGSGDGTAEMVERFARDRPQGGPVSARLLRNGRNRGKGYSIKHGVLMALGDLVLISDADFSTPIDELPVLRQAVENEGYGIAIGSRGLEASRVEIHQAAWREMMGRGFNALVRLLTGLPFRDTQCGFKLARRQEVLPLFRAARVERFAWDVEILYLARKAGVRVREVPVLWRNAAGTKVNALIDPFDMLKDIARVLVRDRLGRYGRLGARPEGGDART